MTTPIVIYSFGISSGSLPAARRKPEYFIYRVLNISPRRSSEDLLEDLLETYKKLFAERKSEKNGFPLGPFSHIEEIRNYAFHLCDLFNTDGIKLLSAEKYNCLLEESHTLSEFKDMLAGKTDMLYDPNFKKKGFFRKFLN